MIELLKKIYVTLSAFLGKSTALLLGFWKPIWLVCSIATAVIGWLVVKLGQLIIVVTDFFASLNSSEYTTSIVIPEQLIVAARYGNAILPINEMLVWSMALFGLYVVSVAIRSVKAWIPTVA